MKNFIQFRFTPDMLDAPRKAGISAYMRIKNEEEFVELAIRSHLEFYDEIVAVYNGYTDRTPEILHRLAEQHPDKIRVFHYTPTVHPIHTKEHARTPTESVHSMANYYNFALSKTTCQVAVKLDADHLAIPQKLAPVIDTIRRDMAAGKKKIYHFSGLNLMCDKNGDIGINENVPFSGNGDILYHPVNRHTVFHNGPVYEEFNAPTARKLETEYTGVLYFHLKRLKARFSQPTDEDKVVSFAEFCSPACRRRMRKQFNPYHRLLSYLYASEKIRKKKYALTGAPPRLTQVRIARLVADLYGIDFAHDALAKLT